MPAALADADIVITATGSQRPIITRAHIEAATGRRRASPLFIIDLAVPRDVEAAVGEIEQVFLYNVDDLQGIVQENLSRRGAEIERAEAIVTEEVSKFIAWQRSRGAVPTVVALRERFEPSAGRSCSVSKASWAACRRKPRQGRRNHAIASSKSCCSNRPNSSRRCPTRRRRPPTPRPSTGCSVCATTRSSAERVDGH